MIDDYHLVMTQGPQVGQEFPLNKDSLTLGRAPDNDVVIDHPRVSRWHARISRQQDRLILRDRGSTNGTFVDGKRLTGPHMLASGDAIGLSEAVTLAVQKTESDVEETATDRPATLPPSPPREETDADSPTTLPPSSLRENLPSTRFSPQSAPASSAVNEAPSIPWLHFGCGVLTLFAIVACIGTLLLNYLGVLPPIFYAPLHWLGLI